MRIAIRLLTVELDGCEHGIPETDVHADHGVNQRAGSTPLVEKKL